MLSVVIITRNEEANIGRTLASVQPLVAEGKGEIIVVDSGSTDRTVEIAKSLGAKVFVEEWKGYAAQKNSAIDKAAGEWILSLDADEERRTRVGSGNQQFFSVNSGATREEFSAVQRVWARVRTRGLTCRRHQDRDSEWDALESPVVRN